MIFVVDQRRGCLIALDSLDDDATFRRVVADVNTLGPMRKPSGIAFDGAGHLVVVDSGNNRVLVLDPNTGSGVSLDPSSSEVGQFRQPTDVAVSSAGQLVVSDTGNHRLVFVEPGEALEWSALGIPGNAGPGEFEAPAGVHFTEDGRILVADLGAGRLVGFDHYGPEAAKINFLAK